MRPFCCPGEVLVFSVSQHIVFPVPPSELQEPETRRSPVSEPFYPYLPAPSRHSAQPAHRVDPKQMQII